jgi:hypothetical protein
VCTRPWVPSTVEGGREGGRKEGRQENLESRSTYLRTAKLEKPRVEHMKWYKFKSAHDQMGLEPSLGLLSECEATGAGIPGREVSVAAWKLHFRPVSAVLPALLRLAFAAHRSCPCFFTFSSAGPSMASPVVKRIKNNC